MTRRLSVLALFGLAACGGSPTIELNLMDAPPEGVTAVKLFVASMDVHVAGDGAKDADPADDSIDDDGKWTSLSVGREIDLVQHQGESAADVLGQLELPEGKITQIRLHLDETRPNVATYQGVDCDLDLSRINAKGIKISHPFKAIQASGDDAIEAWVDVELDRSLKPSGSCFQLEPVVKLHRVKVDGKDRSI